MPKNIFNSEYKFLSREKLLTFEEIVRVVKIFTKLGVSKIRLTGGEPLVRKNLERLIEQLSVINEIQDMSLTTNGSLLTRKKAQSLKSAGLDRITISLDSLDNKAFKKINDVDFPVERILEAVDSAQEAGFTSVKVNMVVKKGVNDHSITPMVEYFRNTGVILRFIEYMDVGSSNNWNETDVISALEIIKLINENYPISPLECNYVGEVAKRWKFDDGGGEIGIISSVSEPFCGTCSRARLSAEGEMYTCLFASLGFNLRRYVRGNFSDSYIEDLVREIWKKRDDRYSELRAKNIINLKKVEMSYIGG
jgi:cyclic pyranopterin phosphate synthase